MSYTGMGSVYAFFNTWLERGIEMAYSGPASPPGVSKKELFEALDAMEKRIVANAYEAHVKIGTRIRTVELRHGDLAKKMDAGFTRMDKRFDTLEKKFDTLEKKFDTLEKKVDQILER